MCTNSTSKLPNRFLCSKKHLFSCHVTNLIRPSVHAHKMCLITLILTKRKQNQLFAVLHATSCSFTTTKLYFPFTLHPTCCNLLNMSVCTKFMNGRECVRVSFCVGSSHFRFPSFLLFQFCCVCVCFTWSSGKCRCHKPLEPVKNSKLCQQLIIQWDWDRDSQLHSTALTLLTLRKIKQIHLFFFFLTEVQFSGQLSSLHFNIKRRRMVAVLKWRLIRVDLNGSQFKIILI